MLLFGATKQGIDTMVTAFTVYHAVKLDHHTAVAMASQTGKYDAIKSLMVRVASAHSIKFGLSPQPRPAVSHAAGSSDDAPPGLRDETFGPAPLTPIADCFRATPEWSRGAAST